MTARESVPDTAREGAGIGLDLELPARRLKDASQGVESLIDPFGMVAPLPPGHVAIAALAGFAGVAWYEGYKFLRPRRAADQ